VLTWVTGTFADAGVGARTNAPTTEATTSGTDLTKVRKRTDMVRFTFFAEGGMSVGRDHGPAIQPHR
jgi:hypothetical protein